MQASAASQILKDFIAPVDSTAVSKLRAAGAILVGSTNMDEMGMGSWSMYGMDGKMVKNPIDNDYFCGGSSGGSAASVASL
jgi:aspartyl-tRNA(Asn)/glutamyl-tRNA(Gln) amidotransferase subunit A